ncbi:MAG: 50S ribosomal protein L6, partial [Acetobacteraceae bacterium]|nr:50S ribosomal protein L6 [Acetobacteraceae bacterium]
MSRIGKKPIAIPNGVQVTVSGQTVTVKGPKGQLAWTVADEIEVKQEEGQIVLSVRGEGPRAQAMWGLSRTLVNNMIVGVTQGYERTLELVGVGY